MSFRDFDFLNEKPASWKAIVSSTLIFSSFCSLLFWFLQVIEDGFSARIEVNSLVGAVMLGVICSLFMQVFQRVAQKIKMPLAIALIVLTLILLSLGGALGFSLLNKVETVFSVHWMLVSAVVCGVLALPFLWWQQPEESNSQRLPINQRASPRKREQWYLFWQIFTGCLFSINFGLRLWQPETNWLTLAYLLVALGFFYSAWRTYRKNKSNS